MSIAKPPAMGASALPAGTFEGQTVFITGGGTGLGFSMATEFCRLGAQVAIVSRKQENVDKGVARLREQGWKAFGTLADIRQPEQIAAAFDAVEAESGPVSVLVNNAAGNFPVIAEKMSPNAWRAVIQIVMDGTFFCSREFAVRRMKAGAGGSVLNIVATTAFTGCPGTAHSAAAKAGVVNLTQSLSVEWAPDDITVNAIAPGFFPHEDTATAILGGKGSGNEVYKTLPAGRPGELQELGWAATFLCSPYARYITGHTLVVDGANWLRRGMKLQEFVPVREQYASAPR